MFFGETVKLVIIVLKKLMKLEIISPAGLLFEGETNSVTFPGAGGVFDVLPHHAPLIAALQAGVIRYESDGKTQEMMIERGFVEVKDDLLSVCVEAGAGSY